MICISFWFWSSGFWSSATTHYLQQQLWFATAAVRQASGMLATENVLHFFIFHWLCAMCTVDTDLRVIDPDHWLCWPACVKQHMDVAQLDIPGQVFNLMHALLCLFGKLRSHLWYDGDCVRYHRPPTSSQSGLLTDYNTPTWFATVNDLVLSGWQNAHCNVDVLCANPPRLANMSRLLQHPTVLAIPSVPAKSETSNTTGRFRGTAQWQLISLRYKMGSYLKPCMTTSTYKHALNTLRPFRIDGIMQPGCLANCGQAGEWGHAQHILCLQLVNDCAIQSIKLSSPFANGSIAIIALRAIT